MDGESDGDDGWVVDSTHFLTGKLTWSKSGVSGGGDR